MGNEQKTLILIPTYDERDNVVPICEEIVALGLDADLLFLDDNSPDGTGRVIDELAAKHPRVKALHRSGKLGVGSAHLDGIAYAYDNCYTLLVTMDCDFTHSPSDIPRMLAARGSAGAALVAGSRFGQRNSLPGWSAMRKGLTYLGHALTRSMLGVTSDATGAFRVYDLQLIPRQLFDLVTEKGYAFFFQSMFIVQQNGLRIIEVPIVLPARTYGHSKMSSAEVLRSVEQLGKLFIERQANPAKFQLERQLAKLDPKLQDSQGWDVYWEKKGKAGALAYDVVAGV
jgi:dolichol-phosphate mannosyltransferase